MPVISAEVSTRDSKLIDRLITEGKYPTKSDIIRTALRNLFKEEKINEGGD